MDAIVPLAVVVGLTQVLKQQFKLEAASAVTLTVIVGVVVQALLSASTALPEPYATIIRVLVTGLVLGLTAAGLYSVAGKFADRVAGQ
jgi:uncharacterized membrane protein